MAAAAAAAPAAISRWTWPAARMMSSLDGVDMMGKSSNEGRWGRSAAQSRRGRSQQHLATLTTKPGRTKLDEDGGSSTRQHCQPNLGVPEEREGWDGKKNDVGAGDAGVNENKGVTNEALRMKLGKFN